VASAPALSVVIPAFNQQDEITRTIEVVSAVLTDAAIPHEVIVVADGCSDNTASRARSTTVPGVRVIEYQPNAGKGNALRVGSAGAPGEWVAWVDADLDLHPSMLPSFLEQATTGGFDAVVGSKRHPASTVDYPRSRRLFSWLYQLLVRVLFRLDVRDTQVGMKVFRGEVLDDVLPLVLVKRYAFDLEVLAVARHLGYERIGEHPVVLDYQFTGSGVRPRAIAQALWDTAAVFYRLRILRYYDRARRGARSS
jgi:glycosyltransferase involved in cell wall biosynthesis